MYLRVRRASLIWWRGAYRCVSERLHGRLAEFSTRVNQLPETREPPPTTLQLLGRNRREEDWQRLLFYFLSPGKAHGLETELLEQVLSALAEREDMEYTFSRLALTDVEIKTEVITSNGRRPDAVIWVDEEWFICFELKVGASEGSSQTSDYVEADAFTSIDVTKSRMTDEHYVYLAPADASPPEAAEFTHVSWKWITSQLEATLETSYGGYPARTTAQLHDFIDTIEQELHMTNYQQNQQEKAELYFDYYDEISEAQDAFEARWETFADNWGTQLVEQIEAGKVTESSSLRDTDVAIDLEIPGGKNEQWVFAQTDSNWGSLFKSRWWLRKDDFSPIYAPADDKNDVRIMFCHRMEDYREQAIKDNTLELEVIHGVGNGRQFKTTFQENLIANIESESVMIPSAVSPGSKQGAPLTASYDIPTREYDDFFDAYVAALTDAFYDLVIDNRQVIELMDETFEESLAVFE